MEPGLTAGRQAGWLADEIWAGLDILKQIKIFDFTLCSAEILHYFNNLDALLTLFSGKYCYKECKIL